MLCQHYSVPQQRGISLQAGQNEITLIWMIEEKKYRSIYKPEVIVTNEKAQPIELLRSPPTSPEFPFVAKCLSPFWLQQRERDCVQSPVIYLSI